MTATSETLQTEQSEPWTALEQAILPALLRPPAVVAFSGGQDSSLILCAALSAARAHALPDPVAVSLRFDPLPATHEDHWQEAVARHLGVTEWEKIHLHEELDLVGDIATDGLRRHGLTFPSNAHSMVPVARKARGGSLLVGIGGDELLRSWRWSRRGGFLKGGASRKWRFVPTTLLGSAPAAVRRNVLRYEAARQLGRSGDFAWLTRAGRRVAARRIVDRDDQPTRWRGFLRWASLRRVTVLTMETLSLLASDDMCEVTAPLLDPKVVDSIGLAGGRWGFESRAAALEAIAGDRLPEALLQRRTKAIFQDAFFGQAARSFAREWDGTGVDTDLVDLDGLRSEWLSEIPDFRSFLLLQSARLRSPSLGSSGAR